MIEVAYAALRLRNPTSVSMADAITPPKQAMGMGLGTPAKVDAAAPATLAQPAAVQAPLKTDLRGAVVDALRQVQDTHGQEGIGISALIARLASAEASSEKVKAVLSQLVDEGDVFTTIDDDHFAIL